MQSLLLFLTAVVIGCNALECNMCQSTDGKPCTGSRAGTCRDADYCITHVLRTQSVGDFRAQTIYEEDCVRGTLLDVSKVGKWTWGHWDRNIDSFKYTYVCNDTDRCNSQTYQIPEEKLPDLISCKTGTIQDGRSSGDGTCQGHFCISYNFATKFTKKTTLICGFGKHEQMPSGVDLTKKSACQAHYANEYAQAEDSNIEMYAEEFCLCASGDNCNANIQPQFSSKLPLYECPLFNTSDTCQGHYCVKVALYGGRRVELGCLNVTDSVDDHGVGCMQTGDDTWGDQVVCRCKGECDVSEDVKQRMKSNESKENQPHYGGHNKIFGF